MAPRRLNPDRDAMARFTGHLVCQAFKVRALDELIELVKVYDWHKGEDGIAVRPEGSDYLFWGAAQVEDPRLVPFEVVPGRDGSLVEQPLRDPTAFMRQIAELLQDDGQAVLMVSGWDRLDLLMANKLTVTRDGWTLEQLFTRPGRHEAGRYLKQEGRF
jgi:hypothetical protein